MFPLHTNWLIWVLAGVVSDFPSYPAYLHVILLDPAIIDFFLEHRLWEAKIFVYI